MSISLVLIPSLICLFFLDNINIYCGRVTVRKKVDGGDSDGLSAHLPSLNTTFKKEKEKRKGGENKSGGMVGGSYIPDRRIFAERVHSFPDPT